MTDVMEKFFAPKSVCVIGASSTPGKPGNVVVKNMRNAGYKGGVYLVNPRGGEIEGYKVHKSIDDLPDGIDQAVVTLPASIAPETVLALGSKGIKAIVLAASGFSEVDHVGEALQEELISLNRQHRRDEMSRLISDEVLETLAIVGDPRSVVERMRERFGGLISRTGFAVPNISDDELGSLLELLRR